MGNKIVISHDIIVITLVPASPQTHEAEDLCNNNDVTLVTGYDYN